MMQTWQSAVEQKATGYQDGYKNSRQDGSIKSAVGSFQATQQVGSSTKVGWHTAA